MERFKQFCEFQKYILKNNKEVKHSNLVYDSLNLKLEEDKLMKKRGVFEIKLNQEIERFGNLNDNKLFEIIKKFTEFIKNSNHEEMKIFMQTEIR